MAVQLFANNADSSLNGAITAIATSITLKTGDGAKFPNPTAGDWFNLTLFQKTGATESNWEIVKVTARAGDVLTVVRGQEGTTAFAFSNGDLAELRWTAAAAAAGANALQPNGSAANLTNFPTLNQNTTGNAATATVAQTVSQANQPSITSVGNLTGVNLETGAAVTANGAGANQDIPMTAKGTGMVKPNRLLGAVYQDKLVAITASTASTVIDLSQGMAFKVTVAANTTLSFTNAPAGSDLTSFTLILLNDATAGRAVTFPTVSWAGGSLPPRTTAASKRDMWTFVTDDAGATWAGSLAIQNY